MRPATPQSRSYTVSFGYGIFGAMYLAILGLLFFTSPILSIKELRSLWPILGSTVESLLALAAIHFVMSAMSATFYRRSWTYRRFAMIGSLLLLVASIAGTVSVSLAAARGTLFSVMSPVAAVAGNSLLLVSYALLLWSLWRVHVAANNRMERPREP